MMMHHVFLFRSQIDDHQPNREEAECLWEKIGNQYLSENEEQLKEKMDFLPDNLDHYPLNGQHYLFFVTRQDSIIMCLVLNL